MPKIIIDASLVIKWFAVEKEEGVEKSRKLFAEILQGRYEVWAPHFLLVEVLNILTKKRKISREVVLESLKVLTASPINFWDFKSTDVLDLEKIMNKYNTTAYDSLYLLLTQKLKSKLITFDKKLLEITNLVIEIDKV